MIFIWRQFNERYLKHQASKSFWKLFTKKSLKSPRVQCLRTHFAATHRKYGKPRSVMFISHIVNSSSHGNAILRHRTCFESRIQPYHVVLQKNYVGVRPEKSTSVPLLFQVQFCGQSACDWWTSLAKKITSKTKKCGFISRITITTQ